MGTRGHVGVWNPTDATITVRYVHSDATDDYLPIWKHMDTGYRGALVAEDALQQRFRRYYRAHLPQSSDPFAEAAE